MFQVITPPPENFFTGIFQVPPPLHTVPRSRQGERLPYRAIPRPMGSFPDVHVQPDALASTPSTPSHAMPPPFRRTSRLPVPHLSFMVPNHFFSGQCVNIMKTWRPNAFWRNDVDGLALAGLCCSSALAPFKPLRPILTVWTDSRLQARPRVRQGWPNRARLSFRARCTKPGTGLAGHPQQRVADRPARRPAKRGACAPTCRPKIGACAPTCRPKIVCPYHPRFLFCGVVSVPRCVLPCKQRTILRMV